MRKYLQQPLLILKGEEKKKVESRSVSYREEKRERDENVAGEGGKCRNR